MEIKNMFQFDNVENTENVFKYVPGSSEKKRAIMMYLFFGIMVSITKKNMSSFEFYHLKQSSGRRILFLLILVFDVVLLFLPVIKYLGLIPLIFLLGAWIINVKQARDGKYYVDKKESLLAIFSGIGNWFIELFEISVITTKDNSIKQSIDSQKFNIDADLDSQNIPNIQSDIEMDLYKK